MGAFVCYFALGCGESYSGCGMFMVDLVPIFLFLLLFCHNVFFIWNVLRVCVYICL